MQILTLFITFFFSITTICAAEMIDLNEMYLGVLEPARTFPEFKQLATKLNICCAIAEKTQLEQALKNDLRYARKYGVINYARRDALVQQIVFDDNLITLGKRDYKAVFGKPFKSSVCKKLSCENPALQLMEFSEQLIQDRSAIKLNAPTLHYNYHQDRQRADEEYEGQTLQILGRITAIKTDSQGNAFLTLKTKDERHPVLAFIHPTDVSILESLSPGNGVEVRCEGAGMTDDSPILKDCQFVEQKSK